MKILYLVISKDAYPWGYLKKIQMKTWLRNLGQGDCVKFISGNNLEGQSSNNYFTFNNTLISKEFPKNKKVFSNIFEIVSNNKMDWVFQSKSGYEQLLTNTISAIDYANKYESYDYIVRTNNSTYWNPIRLRQYLSKSSKSGFYGGVSRMHQNIEYVEGYGVILSRDVSGLLVSHSHILDNRIIDDVAIGALLSKFDINITEIEIPWINSLKDLSKIDYSNISKKVAIRCKLAIPIMPIRFLAYLNIQHFPKIYIRLDFLIMKKIHKALTGANSLIKVTKNRNKNAEEI